MQIQINYGSLSRSDALTEHVQKQVEHAMRHYVDRFTRIEVHLHDDNAAKSGPNDKRCVIEARPSGANPLVVESTGSDAYATATEASKKLERAARHWVERHRSH